MTKNIDYTERNSVRRNNKGVDLYRKSAKYIGENHLEKIDEFALLLNDMDDKIRICCAVCLVELMNPSKSLRLMAIKTVTEHWKKSTGHEKIGWQIWLDKHKDV